MLSRVADVPAMNDAINDNHHHQHPFRWQYSKFILITLVVIGAATTISTHFQLSSAYVYVSGSTMLIETESSPPIEITANGETANAAMDRFKNSMFRGDDGTSENDDNYWTPSSTHNATATKFMNSTISSSNNAIMDQHKLISSNSSIGHGDSATSSEGMHVCTCLTNRHPMNSNLSLTPPKRLRWLHIPKTGTSFISTLWAYMTTTEHRYIDLAVNSQWCSKETTASYSMYDFALMRRYPWEMYGAPNMIPSSFSSSDTTVLDSDLPLGLVGGTQHQPLAQNFHDKAFTSSLRYQRAKQHYKKFGSEIFEHNFTVATFFRQPEDRIVSAFYDARHASGFKPELFKELMGVSRLPTTSSSSSSSHTCKIGDRTYHNPLECFARFPGIAGCMSRMLTGETCADGLFEESGLENLPDAIDIIMNHLEFVGLMEEWNESICQFHRLYTGKLVDIQNEHGDAGSSSVSRIQRRHWIPPLQGEFSNVHKSTKQKDYSLQDLNGFSDVADTVVYEAAKLKFQQMVGGERCYRYMTWDEIVEARRERKDGDDDDYLSNVKVEDDGQVCQPKSCSDLGRQCGEWDDGCGRTIICGMCNIARTGLPSTWRVECVEGQCMDYCPPWNDKGYWFLSDDSPSVMKQITNELGIRNRSYLSPVDAISICELACNTSNKRSKQSQRKGLKSFVSSGLCKCGTSPKISKANLTVADFSKAHDLHEMCSMNKARNSATLTEKETQPICCPYIDEKATPPAGWKRQYVMGSINLEGEYFDHVRIECGGFQECQSVARKKKAELAVFDLFNSMCYLARNVFDLKSLYTVTKDNQYRYSLDLR